MECQFTHSIILNDCPVQLSQIVKKNQNFILSEDSQLNFSEQEKIFLLEAFSPEHQLALQHGARNLLLNKTEVRITRYGNNIPVFVMDAMPEVVFKFNLHEPEEMKVRYEAMQAGIKICREENLDLLFVPECALIKINGIDIVAEKNYPLKRADKNIEKKQYLERELELGELVRQLTVFICKSFADGKKGFADLKFNNIPPIEMDNVLKVVLLDLEPHLGKCLKDALCGWTCTFNDNCAPTPGLMRCFPRYCEVIYETAKQIVSAEEFEGIKQELDKTKAKAEWVNQRRQEIEIFHQDKGILQESPVIPTDLELPYPDKQIYQLIIQDINGYMANKNSREFKLSMGRRDLLTVFQKSLNNHKEYSPFDIYYIVRDKLLPYLLEKGVIHSFIEEDKHADLDIDLSRYLSSDDIIIQF